MKRAALYLRVSTADQTTFNQERELQEAASRHGWQIAVVLRDEGISGAKGRDKRPGFDSLLKMVNRKEIDIVCAWSVDRLGRSLQDLIETLNTMRDKSVDLYLHQQGLDTSTPAGRALFQMLGVFAEFERCMIRDRVMAGVARAKAQGKHCGRPKLEARKEQRIRELLGQGVGMGRVAAETGTSAGTVHRIAVAMRGEGAPRMVEA